MSVFSGLRTGGGLCVALVAACTVTLAQQDTTAAADSALARQLQQEMPAQGQTQAGPQQSASHVAPSTNPGISIIGDFRASYLTPARRHFDAGFNEAELAAQSYVDPYARADFFFSVARNPATGDFGIDLEEGYLTSLDLPAQLQLRVGKFRSTFGKINNIHPHALPFIDQPAMYQNYFGDEGLNDEGFSASWLVPNPWDFYQELVVEVTRGPSNDNSFVVSDVDRFLYLAHLKNFWDLTENATLELGLSATAGPNDSAFTTALGGVDLTYKWKPVQFNTYKMFVLQGEALWSDKRITPGRTVKSWGMYALAEYQLEQRVFLTARFDYSNLPDNASYTERGYSATLGWLATEFQKIEVEVKTTTSHAFPTATQVLLRSIFVIGTHGAHAY